MNLVGTNSDSRDFEQLKNMVASSLANIEAIGHRTGRPYFYLGDGWALSMLSTGQPFFVDTRDRVITPWILMGGHWETNVDNVLTTFVRPGMHIVDVGAHMGYYTIKLGGKIGPKGRLDSFEPNPEMATFLRENINLNGLFSQVVLHRTAAGSRKETGVLSMRKGNTTSASLLSDTETATSYEVPIDTLDAMLECRNDVSLIKIDAEGFEPAVLEGSQKTLSESPNCALMIELSLERWERSRPLEDLTELVAGRVPYAVTPDGGLRRMVGAEIRGFLMSCLFTENYFLFLSPGDDESRRRLDPLIAE